MSSTVQSVPLVRSGGALARLGAYVELTKPRISVLVLATVFVGGYLASWGQPKWDLLLHAILGTALVAASASAVNQWMERQRDARMPRTASRPLPSGRLTSGEALGFAAITGLVGVPYLLWMVGGAPAGLALLTWVLYVLVYTPLKPRTAMNTAVGAVPGALPVLIGWTAVGAPLSLGALALFMVLFLWQFPHFMAIAWLYRDDYRAGGMKMISVVDPSGQRSGWQAVTAALAVLMASMVPAVLAHMALPTGAALPYAAVALLLGSLQLAASLRFMLRIDDSSARSLLRMSLIYLPALLLALTLIVH